MYAGHTSDGRIQPLSEHLGNVAKLCASFAKPFGAEEWARLIGLCHDIGKYSDAAQDRLLRNGKKVDHSTAGGKEINKVCGPIAAYCVLGHHTGLPNGGTKTDTASEPTLAGRLKKEGLPDYSAFASEVRISGVAEPCITPLDPIGFSMSMLTRMLFSCLVDADRLDTEAFMTAGDVQRGGYKEIPALHKKLTEHIQPFLSPSNALNRKRSEILQDCLQMAVNKKGLYSLTVPTGGGKTISSLAFALAHAKQHGMERVIYVIPYTSIIEQNAAVFANILGHENVLEHHSSVEYDNESEENDVKNRLYLSTENWDAPIVVTTNVQFFESFFAAKTSKCRKLHNIANSVIVFDEAQMLPLPYLKACTHTIGELVHNYNCTALLCSATQPALDNFFPKEVQRTEICKNPEEMYTFFRRNTMQQLGQLTDDILATRLSAVEQVLCIVGTRKQAQNIYKLLKGDGNYHLSTLMYPEHRKRTLAKIRLRLIEGQPCRVVSTSLIEAGVDVDFPIVYRARAGLDSIVQAAGRCNREGKRPREDSMVYVFDPDSEYALPIPQMQPLEVMGMVAARHADIASLEAIHEYFSQLFQIKGDGLDQKKIIKQLEDGWNKGGGSFPFRTIADEFKLIETNTHAVLIPNMPQGANYAQRLREGERSRELLRNVGRYSVNIYEYHFKELVRMGIVELLDTEITILAEMGSYTNETGLALAPESGKAIFVE